MKNIILIFALIFSASFTFAQNNLKKEPETTSRQASIMFKQTVCDFGVIKHGEEAKAVFQFKNLTKKPVKLTNVRASCGCTGTEWPREEIKKRGKGTVSVSYDTRRVGKFNKNVYVYVEGNDQPIQLQVKGEVLPNNKNMDKNMIGGKQKLENKKAVKKSSDNSVKHVKRVESKSATNSGVVRESAAPQKHINKKEDKSLEKNKIN
ncbi:MAG: DUF1573 domain-containing protein [Bacteroidales bacterium]|nr:DUF1573 domain-containing protein [Bacteroidales bacterium]